MNVLLDVDIFQSEIFFTAADDFIKHHFNIVDIHHDVKFLLSFAGDQF